jgi:hypothetical protein
MTLIGFSGLDAATGSVKDSASFRFEWTVSA